MNKLVRRSGVKAASRACLIKLVEYISDPKHKDHIGKILGIARNRNCDSQSADDFIRTVIRAEHDYRDWRRGKQGKRGTRIFEEIIFSTPEGTWTNEHERQKIADLIIERFCAQAAARENSHCNPETGRDDIHIIFAAKTRDYPPQLTLWSRFGSGGDNLNAEFDRLDVEIIEMLNQNPERAKRKLKSATRVRKDEAQKLIGAKPTLAAEIAAKTLSPIDMDNLRAVIEGLGHKVTRLTSRAVSVVFNGRAKPRRFNIEDLLLGISVEQELLGNSSSGSSGTGATRSRDVNNGKHFPSAATNAAKMGGVNPPL